MIASDEMKITSGFTKNIISKIIEKLIRNKTQRTIGVSINDLQAIIIDGKTHVHIDADFVLTKEELLNALKDFGI